MRAECRCRLGRSLALPSSMSRLTPREVLSLIYHGRLRCSSAAAVKITCVWVSALERILGQRETQSSHLAFSKSRSRLA